MAKSKQVKAAGREQHRKMQKEKKMAKKQKKNQTLPARHMKNKR